MKVLMISTDPKIFKSGSSVRGRMKEYADNYGYLLICVVGQGSFPSEQINENLKAISKGRIRALFWQPTEIFDLVTSQDPFENGLIAWFLAKRLKAKLELQIHTDFLNPYFRNESFLNKIRVSLSKFLLPRADKIRVVSQRIADSLQTTNYKLKAELEIRPIFVDTEKIKTAPIKTDLHKKYPQFTKIILMASRLTKEKNISLVIKSMYDIVKTRPEVGLIIVGSGPEKWRLRLLTTNYNLQPNIVFEPWTNDLPSYYKTCDLFLLTSWYEGYGMTLVEASAAGCKIISTDVGVAREVGAMITSYDPHDLAGKILATI